MTMSGVIDTQSCADRRAVARVDADPEKVGRFLRKVHPVNTAAEVSVKTGIPTRTVQRYLASCPVVPSGGALLRLIFAYGPEFLAAILPDAPAWVDRAKAEERRAALEAERMAIEEKLAELRGDTDA
jgi:hypothetical protein